MFQKYHKSRGWKTERYPEIYLQTTGENIKESPLKWNKTTNNVCFESI